MAEFERGDIVVYRHVKNGDVKRNGSMGIVTSERDPYGDPVITWISHGISHGSTEVVRAPYPYNLEKVGHIDLPPEPPRD